MKRSGWAVAVVLALATLASAQIPASGGGAARSLPELHQREIEKHLGPGVVGPAVETQPIGTIADYFSRSDERLTFQSVQGKDAGAAAVGRFIWLQRPDGSRGWKYDAGATRFCSDAPRRRAPSRSSAARTVTRGSYPGSLRPSPC